MEKVFLTYRGPLKDCIKKDGEEIDAYAVKDALKFIKAAYGAEAHTIAKRMLIAVNGKSILLMDNMKTVLAPGDTIAFLPIAGGG